MQPVDVPLVIPLYHYLTISTLSLADSEYQVGESSEAVMANTRRAQHGFTAVNDVERNAHLLGDRHGFDKCPHHQRTLRNFQPDSWRPSGLR